MRNSIIKPKLIFFRPISSQNIASFILLQRQQHFKCLSEFFEVIVISEDCDYRQICDKYQPDLTLFENAGNILECHRLTITNIHTHPQIPKLGFLNADAWCNSRAVFLSEMEHWGVKTFFTMSVVSAEHTPEIAENLFVWPNCIDPEICKDYNESKIVPVLFTGANYALYPWRQKILKSISQYYPSLICPHLGYNANRSIGREVIGEKYSRTINASWFVPTCGTIAKEVVRKHFEIPACRSCLITEQSPALEAAGFINMQNCVFVDEHNVLDKLDYLFQNQDELERIIDAGYDLVHARHTLKQRDQILQWFNLHKHLKSHQKIIQTNPFEPLAVVEKSSGLINDHIKCNGLSLMLIQQGDRELQLNQYDKAESLYLQCSYHVGIMHEPKLRLGICNLYKGNADKSLELIAPLVKVILEVYKAFDPDPVEWAYFIVTLLCLGKLEEAKKRCDEFPSLSHIELDRVRWVVKLLTQPTYQYTYPSSGKLSRASVHCFPKQNLSKWTKNIATMLRACGQLNLAKKLELILLDRDFLDLSEQNFGKSVAATVEISNSIEAVVKADIVVTYEGLKAKSSKIFLRSEFSKKFINRIKQVGSKVLFPLNHLETRFGYFLPFSISDIKNDEFFGTLGKMIVAEDTKNILLIGGDLSGRVSKLVLNISQKLVQNLTVFCVSESTPISTKLQRHYKNNPKLKFYQLLSTNSPDNIDISGIGIKDCVGKIKLEHKVDYFDLVIIDFSAVIADIELISSILVGSMFLVLDNINTLQGYKEYHYLSENPSYILESQNPRLRGGYAIFKAVN
ncbi:MAG: hypothetical protein DCF20_18470 [Pseudanabaena sp.]|nr:MAG: hypothetical protein DCF20_18470 [Pseudanabaena sp.]